MATDLVGRGVDVERVNIVINYDMPETDEVKGNGADTYLHRVSWAGLGTSGFFCPAAAWHDMPETGSVKGIETNTFMHGVSCCHLSVADLFIHKLSGSCQVKDCGLDSTCQG